MKIIIMRTIFFLFLFLSMGCSNQSSTTIPKCAEVNKNTILLNSPWDSKEYFDEMVNLLYKEKDIRYFYDGKILQNGATFFIVKCFGNDFCGNIFLYLGEGDSNSELLNDEDKYKGAELFGLKWHLDDLKFKTYLVYDSVEKIKK